MEGDLAGSGPCDVTSGLAPMTEDLYEPDPFDFTSCVEEAIMVLEDDSPVEAISTPSTPRNLCAWKITIPYVDFDDIKKERIPVFCIDVERNDRKAGHETEHCSVYRRYLEFYVLESKLTEFHGSFPDAQLPSKRIIGPKNYEFLMSKREEFQEYLQGANDAQTQWLKHCCAIGREEFIVNII
ncbi:SNX14 protein, partial [Polypterus senegalus]